MKTKIIYVTKDYANDYIPTELFEQTEPIWGPTVSAGVTWIGTSSPFCSL